MREEKNITGGKKFFLERIVDGGIASGEWPLSCSSLAFFSIRLTVSFQATLLLQLTLTFFFLSFSRTALLWRLHAIVVYLPCSATGWSCEKNVSKDSEPGGEAVSLQSRFSFFSIGMLFNDQWWTVFVASSTIFSLQMKTIPWSALELVQSHWHILSVEECLQLFSMDNFSSPWESCHWTVQERSTKKESVGGNCFFDFAPSEDFEEEKCEKDLWKICSDRKSWKAFLRWSSDSFQSWTKMESRLLSSSIFAAWRCWMILSSPLLSSPRLGWPLSSIHGDCSSLLHIIETSPLNQVNKPHLQWIFEDISPRLDPRFDYGTFRNSSMINRQRFGRQNCPSLPMFELISPDRVVRSKLPFSPALRYSFKEQFFSSKSLSMDTEGEKEMNRQTMISFHGNFFHLLPSWSLSEGSVRRSRSFLLTPVERMSLPFDFLGLKTIWSNWRRYSAGHSASQTIQRSRLTGAILAEEKWRRDSLPDRSITDGHPEETLVYRPQWTLRYEITSLLPLRWRKCLSSSRGIPFQENDEETIDRLAEKSFSLNTKERWNIEGRNSSPRLNPHWLNLLQWSISDQRDELCLAPHFSLIFPHAMEIFVMEETFFSLSLFDIEPMAHLSSTGDKWFGTFSSGHWWPRTKIRSMFIERCADQWREAMKKEIHRRDDRRWSEEHIA